MGLSVATFHQSIANHNSQGNLWVIVCCYMLLAQSLNELKYYCTTEAFFGALASILTMSHVCRRLLLHVQHYMSA